MPIKRYKDVSYNHHSLYWSSNHVHKAIWLDLKKVCVKEYKIKSPSKLIRRLIYKFVYSRTEDVILKKEIGKLLGIKEDVQDNISNQESVL